MADCDLYEEAFVEMDDEDEEEELDLDAEVTKCIFCENTFTGCQATWDHCAKSHNFPLTKLAQGCQLDCFTYIKFINYMRNEKPSVEKLEHILTSKLFPWEGDEFMKPVLSDDPLLMYDVDEAITCVEGSANGETSDNQELAAAKLEVLELQQKLQEALENLQKMRVATQQLVLSTVPQSSHIGPSSSSSIAADEDQGYFGSYSHFGIHQEMLQDKVRTDSYRQSIEMNSEMFKDKVVLDVGCGTGILSMFAARAGAKKVIGVDMSDVIYQAIDVVRENGLEEKITLLRGKVEEIDLPVEQVDIIISEWMGYFLLFESMLDTVIHARDRWLSPEGHVLPNRSSIWLQGFEDQDLKERHVTFWNDVYGFKMSSMKNAVLSEASVQTVKADKAVTDSVCVKELDHTKCTVRDLDFTSPFKLQCSRTCNLMAIVAYFICDFDSMNVKTYHRKLDSYYQTCGNKVCASYLFNDEKQVQLSTAPSEPNTHWKQTVFFLEESLHLESGQTLEGQIICRKNPKDPRSLKIVLTLNGKSLKYVME